MILLNLLTVVDVNYQLGNRVQIPFVRGDKHMLKGQCDSSPKLCLYCRIPVNKIGRAAA